MNGMQAVSLLHTTLLTDPGDSVFITCTHTCMSIKGHNWSGQRKPKVSTQPRTWQKSSWSRRHYLEKVDMQLTSVLPRTVDSCSAAFALICERVLSSLADAETVLAAWVAIVVRPPDSPISNLRVRSSYFFNSLVTYNIKHDEYKSLNLSCVGGVGTAA